MKKILDYSKENLHWVLSSNDVDSIQKALQLCWQVTYSNHIPVLPYFANRLLNLNSEFADFWLQRFKNRGIFRENPWQLTRLGRRSIPTRPFKMPSLNPPIPVLPYSTILPNQITIGNKTVKQKLAINESSLILVELLPPEIPYYFILSYYLEGCMNSLYPLIQENDTLFSVFMDDPTLRIIIPDIQELKRKYACYTSYLKENVDDASQFLKVILFYLLSIGEITRIHICNGNTKVVNKIGDKIIQQIDSEPSCEDCKFQRAKYSDLVTIKHRLNYSWQNGELSELFFSKLLNAKLGSSYKVYPRASIEGLPHECDVLVLGNGEARLFELKRSTQFDNWCKKGVNQLIENKKVLEQWKTETTTFLVTNIKEDIDIEGVDNHLNPSQILDLGSFI